MDSIKSLFLTYRYSAYGSIVSTIMVMKFQFFMFQVVFDVSTQLVKKTFTFKNVGRYAADIFRAKAQFTMSDLQEAIKHNGDALIPLEKMVVFMEHHKILAALPIKDDSTEPTYFMPCVLKSSTCAELQQVHSSPDNAPLMIRYECGYMPLGIFFSLFIGIVSHDENDWELVEEDLIETKLNFKLVMMETQ